MSAYPPRQLVIYRDIDRFHIGRIEAETESHIKLYPFDANRHQFQRGRRSIAKHAIVNSVAKGTRLATLTARIEALRHQRDAKRMQANTWLEEQVAALGAPPEAQLEEGAP